jgi:hypothetical protein
MIRTINNNGDLRINVIVNDNNDYNRRIKNNKNDYNKRIKINIKYKKMIKYMRIYI